MQKFIDDAHDASVLYYKHGMLQSTPLQESRPEIPKN
jgi:hypothetical protein